MGNLKESPKDVDDASVHRIVLCVAVIIVLMVTLPISGWFCLHAIGWRSTKIVSEIEVFELEDRYTIPAKKHSRSYFHHGMYTIRTKTWWTPAEEVNYEDWTLTATDGFVFRILHVDPKNPPEVKRGDRYTTWWY